MRLLTVALVALYALVAFAPGVTAASSFTAASGGLTLADVESGADGRPAWSIDAKTPVASLVHLGPLEYVLEQTEKVVDQVRTGGMQCAYDTGSNRDSLVCFCLELTWDCQDTVVTKWTCYASVGPFRNVQAGIVCLPPRIKA